MKRIFFLTLCSFFFLPLFSSAQNLNLDEPLPIDKTIKKGVLPNGMTYYIKSTDVVKEAASYYIIQNVGSILENDDQQGLAHFLEHMAFNGTESFPGKSILNTLQKHGAVFGKDINAYTSFDETVYNLNNIPTKDDLIDTCLTILNDWSNYLLLTDEEIDAERGVIKEEWRSRQNGQMRLYNTSLPITFNYSKYAYRLPIGLMSVVEEFNYKALRDFYHDWYRTDLQAIAVVGDINVDEVEQKIIEKFSKIPAVENPRERFVVDIPDNKEMLYSLGMDSEISTANISFGIRHKNSLEAETVADLKQSLLEGMVMSMLSSRIREQAQKSDATFLNAYTSFGSMTRTTNSFNVGISPKTNQQKEAFYQVFTEVVRAVKFGFIQSEIDRAIVQLKSSYENQIATKDAITHKWIVGSMQNNYLENKTICDIEQEYEIAKQIFDGITIEELHNTIKRLYTQENRYLNVTGVEGQDNLTEEQAKKAIKEIESNSTIEPYFEDLIGKTLVSDITINEGEIAKTETNSEIGATTFILSNGVKVHYKFVDKEKDRVTLNGYSYGGESLLNDDDLPSASLMRDLMQMSGLGDFSSTDLKKILAGKTANVNVNLGEITENFFGNSNTKDVETMLQMLHVYFVKPRFDEEAFKVLGNNLDNYLARRSKDVGEQMRDSMKVTIYGKNNPKEAIFNKDFVSKISFDKIKAIYNDRFGDASDFEFYIVGDVTEAQLKPLLKKYVASIPTDNTTEVFKDNGAEWISNKIDEDIYLTMADPKAKVNIAYKKELPYTIENSLYTNALGGVLQLRITETVRESEGGAYSPRAYATFFREPKSKAFISVSFDCNPDLADKLVEIVKDELQKMANGEINEDDLFKIKTNFIKEREQSKDKNAYDLQLLTAFYRYGYNMNNSENFEDIVNNMSIKNIQQIVKQVISEGQSYEIVFKPKTTI
ncbi:insulinase family protein [Lutibacter sp. HS1-25]|uniref:M16 family metallopeptidase n=1 Tax=Lutibacter sp. HS1-25 TaxID=2485000 RepID=UPI0010100E9B|nr:M16 family metallopeptidase [Lutibacter sp. HS1-25]RXP46576.1 insulinase family protein [Lutibacter sp. HS1-25]